MMAERPIAFAPENKPAESTEARSGPRGSLDGREPGAGGAGCEFCKSGEAKYRCPCCGLRTCSLICINGHKTQTGCTGKRKRVEFVKMAEFGDKQLCSDIRFLEEVVRERDSAVRREPPHSTHLSPGLQELRRQAWHRGVRLDILQPGMHRRAINNSDVDRRSKRLRWHVEWHFVAADLKIHERVSEDVVLGAALQKHVRPQRRGFKDDEKMRRYTEQGVEGLRLAMRYSYCKVGTPRYHAMDAKRTLGSQLAKKIIVEFPTLLVLLPEEAAAYDFPQPVTPATDVTASPASADAGTAANTEEGGSPSPGSLQAETPKDRSE